MKDVKLENCFFVKTTLMLLIVLYHSLLFWSNTWFVGSPVYSSDFLLYFARWLNSFHVYTFVLVAGYVFYYLKYELKRYDNFSRFIKNKVKRLLVPYVFVSSVWVIPISQMFYDDSIKEIVEDYVLAISPSQLWFLIMLFGIFWFFLPTSDYFKKNDFGAFIIVILLYRIGCFCSGRFVNIFQIWNVLQYIIFFLIGFKIRQYGTKALTKIPSVIYLLVDIAIFICVQFVPITNAILYRIVHVWLGLGLKVIGSLMAFIILQKIGNAINWKPSKLFTLLGGNSMTIYLFH